MWKALSTVLTFLNNLFLLWLKHKRDSFWLAKRDTHFIIRQKEKNSAGEGDGDALSNSAHHVLLLELL